MTRLDTATTVRPTGDGTATGLGIVPADQDPGVHTTCWAVASRTLKKFVRTPQLIVVSTMEGAIFLLFFRYVFGGAMDAGGVSGVEYVDFLVPGFVAVGVTFAGLGAAAGVAEDVQQGFFDRVRSLPVSRTALLAGRALADTALVAWSSLMMIIIGFAVGFRIAGSVAEALAALGLVVAYGFAFTWLFIWIGLIAGNAQAAQGMSMIVFPLMFVSSGYVPVDTMPGWMQAFAEHQPITAMANAVRSLALGDPAALDLSHGAGYWAVVSLLWSAGLVVIFAPLAVLRYRSS